MNRFQDLSNNNTTNNRFRYSGRMDVSNNRFRSNNRFQSRNESSSRFSSMNRSNLPTNNRWKRDDRDEKKERFSNNRNRYPRQQRQPHLEPHELNSKFTDLKSLGRGFDVITTKPKQNKKNKKNKKKNKNTIVEAIPERKKYSKKYDLSKDEENSLNDSIVNQYNYEVIEETDSGEDSKDVEQDE